MLEQLSHERPCLGSMASKSRNIEPATPCHTPNQSLPPQLQHAAVSTSASQFVMEIKRSQTHQWWLRTPRRRSTGRIWFENPVYQCTAPELYSKALKTNQSNTFRFSLTNEKNQLLNLLGVDMLLTLCLYKRDDTNELIRRYIKYKAAGDKNAGNDENNSSG